MLHNHQRGEGGSKVQRRFAATKTAAQVFSPPEIRRFLGAGRSGGKGMIHDPATRSYVKRRTREGGSKREIIRSLKRYLARQLPIVISSASTQPLDRR